MKCDSNDAIYWDVSASKSNRRERKSTVFPELRSPEEFGRSYSTDQLRNPSAWLTKLRAAIAKRGNDDRLR